MWGLERLRLRHPLEMKVESEEDISQEGRHLHEFMF